MKRAAFAQVGRARAAIYAQLSDGDLVGSSDSAANTEQRMLFTIADG